MTGGAARPAVARSTAVLALLLNAAVWGLSWWPFRQLQAIGLHPLWATACIYLLAALVIVVARPHALADLLRTPSLWVLVLAAGSTNASFNWGVVVGDVVRVVLLFYLMPLWAVLLARGLLGERADAAAWRRVLLALVGAGVVLWPPAGQSFWPLRPADLLGLVGGATFALNNVMLRRERERSAASRALAMFVGGAGVSALLATVLAFHGTVAWPPAPSSGWLAAVVALGVAFLVSNGALQVGAARLPSHVTAVVMLSEVLFASVSALALGGGEAGWRVAVGGGLIVLASLLAARGERG